MSVLLAVCGLGTACSGPVNVVVTTPAASGWQAYSSPISGVTLSLPPSWRAVDLGAKYEDIYRAADGVGPQAAAQVRQLVAKFDQQKYRWFAFDTATAPGAAQLTIAYAFTGNPQPAGMEAFLRGIPSPSPAQFRREVLELKQVRPAPDEIFLRRVRDTAVDHSATSVVRYEFLTTVGRTWSALFFEVVPDEADGYDSTIRRIGLSFKPIF